MNLLLIILLIIVFSFIPKIFPKSYKLCVVISILVVLSSYFFIARNFYHTKNFFPSQKIQTYDHLWNHYNFIVVALKNHRLSLIVDDYNKPIPENTEIYRTYTTDYILQDRSFVALWDMSVYKGKLYLYFGITPVLLFYLPFNLISGMYLTDNLLVFILACLIFLSSLFLIKILIKDVLTTRFLKKNSDIHILIIFLVGFCSLIPFILIRTSIYEAAISTATFLLLISFIILYYYLYYGSATLLLCLGIVLSLSVGARPFYVLFIPVIFIILCLSIYQNTKNIKFTIKQAVIFLIPCVIIGTGLALYNYLRFDSIFEFGFKYVLNYENHYEQTPTIKDVFIAMKYGLFNIPDMNDSTVFSLAKTEGHLFANGKIVGVLWTFPISVLFVLLPKFLKNIFRTNKNIFYILISTVFVICLNIFITSSIGSFTRYQFEYLILMTILSIIIFCFYFNDINDKLLKRFFHIIFILIFFWSLFINTSLLLCKENFMYGDNSRRAYIEQITQFLF